MGGTNQNYSVSATTIDFQTANQWHQSGKFFGTENEERPKVGEQSLADEYQQWIVKIAENSAKYLFTDCVFVSAEISPGTLFF